MSLTPGKTSPKNATGRDFSSPAGALLVSAVSLPNKRLAVSVALDGYPATLAVVGDNLVLSVTPEPSTLALLAAGAIGLVAYGWRRRRAAGGTAKPAAFDQAEPQDDAPAILFFPSHSSPASAAQRAA